MTDYICDSWILNPLVNKIQSKFRINTSQLKYVVDVDILEKSILHISCLKYTPAIANMRKIF